MVSFNVESDQYRSFLQFNVVNAHAISEIFVVLQLAPYSSGMHAGNRIKIPHISVEI